jgi:hypothetical protein
MSWTFDIVTPSQRDELRVHIGDVTLNDGPAPDRANLSNETLDYFLGSANGVAGAVALAFDHLAALWIARPIFGPGELSTIHVDMYRKYKQAAEDWRARDTVAGDLGSATVVTVGSFTREDGFTDSGSEYTA